MIYRYPIGCPDPSIEISIDEYIDILLNIQLVKTKMESIHSWIDSNISFGHR